VADLALDESNPHALLAFLDHVESRRGNCPRLPGIAVLAAVRSFVQHLRGNDVTRAVVRRILAIRQQKALRRAATFFNLEPDKPRR